MQPRFRPILRAAALSLALVFAGTPALAAAMRAPEPELRVADDGHALRLKPPRAHHFNIEAPMSLSGEGGALLKPWRADEHEVIFEPKLAVGAPFQVTAYLCDDAKTFCEKHSLRAKWVATPGTVLTAEVVTAAAGTTAATLPPAPHGAEGFIVNEPDRAFAEAKRDGKPVMIDFFGIWCPPCNELDEQVFPRPEVRHETDRFVRLKLDADSDVSWPLKERYKITGYPTILFAAPNGDEISRVVGFREAPRFVEELKSAWASRADGETQWRARAEAGDAAAAERLGHLAFERRDYAAAVKWLAGRQAARETYEDARIGLIGDGGEKDAAAYRKQLETTLKEFPDSARSLDRLQKLAESYEGAKQSAARSATLERLAKLAGDLLTHPERLAGTDLTPADLHETIASAYEDAGKVPEARSAYAKAAAAFRAQRKKENERGVNLELAYCLWKSGDVAGAEKLYSALERDYPREFTFYYAHANMDHELKRLEPAQTLADRAYEFSYGDNRLRAGALRAKILRDRGKSAQAKDVIRDTLASVKIPEDPANRSHRYVRALKELDQALVKG